MFFKEVDVFLLMTEEKKEEIDFFSLGFVICFWLSSLETRRIKEFVELLTEQ